MTLTEAYDLSEAAEELALAKRFREASKNFALAGELFKQVLENMKKQNAEWSVLQALELLATQQNKRAIQMILEYKLTRLVDARTQETKKTGQAAGGNRTFIGTLATKRGKKTSENSLNGEYSMINDADESKADTTGIQQGIMALFDLFAIDPNLDDIGERPVSKDGSLENKLHSELAYEVQRLRKELLRQGKLAEVFRRLQANEDRSSQFVLIDKTMFNSRLGAFLQANSRSTARISAVSTASNSTAALLSSVSNKAGFEKDAEIRRLQYLHGTQEKQVHAMAQRARAAELERDLERARIVQLETEISRLRKQLEIATLKAQQAPSNVPASPFDLNYQYDRITAGPKERNPLQSDDDDDEDEEDFSSSSDLDAVEELRQQNSSTTRLMTGAQAPMIGRQYVSSFRR